MFNKVALGPEQYAQDLYDGFADGIGHHLESLNFSSLPHIINMTGNRAYTLNGKPYADLLHFKNIHEHIHGSLLRVVERERQWQRGKVYLGVGGAINLSYIAAARPACAILCDINPLQKILWSEIISLLRRAPDSSSFKQMLPDLEERVLERVKDVHNVINFTNSHSITTTFDRYSIGHNSRNIFRRNGDIRNWLEDQAACDHFWLNEKEYGYIQELACKDSIASITLDILDADSCHEFSRHLRSKTGEIDIGLIYISSIADFLAVGKEWTGRSNQNFRKIIIDNLEILNPAKNARIIGSGFSWEQKQSMDISISNGFYPLL